MSNKIQKNENCKSIIIIIDYFGKWPEWFPLFLESCKRNPTIDWLFHTDCSYEQFKIPNVSFKTLTKEKYIENVNKRLKLNFTLLHNYKLCDLKPMCGVLYEEEIRNYDFYGYGDIDVIYGNIRNFYTPEVLENYVISTHTWCVSGHLALFRNTKWLRNSFKRYRGWKTLIEKPECQRFDEDLFINVFKYPRINPKLFSFYDILNPLSKKYRNKLYFVEQFTTPLTPSPWRSGDLSHPQVWYWKDGKLTNEKDGNKEYIYLHFMNFVSGRWMNPMYKKAPIWKDLNEIIFIEAPQMAEIGMVIDRLGFHMLKKL